MEQCYFFEKEWLSPKVGLAKAVSTGPVPPGLWRALFVRVLMNITISAYKIIPYDVSSSWFEFQSSWLKIPVFNSRRNTKRRILSIYLFTFRSQWYEASCKNFALAICHLDFHQWFQRRSSTSSIEMNNCSEVSSLARRVFYTTVSGLQ